MGINELKLYEEGVITNVKASGDIKRRFMDIGIVKGAKVKPVLTGKNIKAYLVKGTVVAIRDRDTMNIEVSL